MVRSKQCLHAKQPAPKMNQSMYTAALAQTACIKVMATDKERGRSAMQDKPAQEVRIWAEVSCAVLGECSRVTDLMLPTQV